MSEKYLTVSALTKYLKTKFTRDPYLQRVYLTGEISNYRVRPTHQYFSLKDENAVISATMFQQAFRKVKFALEDGQRVLVIGRVDLYEKSGQYQIIIEHIEPDGIGAMYQAYRQLHEKLASEGIFDEQWKKTLPKYPKRIAVVTSESGAVIRDILTTVKRRYPIVQVVVFPTVVQGKEAKHSIVASIRKVEACGDFDVMLVARGGGSIEDLWSFNEEEVVREIFQAKTPVISCVGHETDTTLADLVSDVRAATPTAAAELATPVLSEELQKITQFSLRLEQAFSAKLTYYQERMKRVKTSYVFLSPMRLYEGIAQRLDRENERLLHFSPEKRLTELQVQLQICEEKMVQAMNRLLETKDIQVKSLIQALDLLSPLKIMTRGFTVATLEEKIVKSVDELSENDELCLQFADGEVRSKVVEVKKKTED
ncbi:Exodeoxyribonuclease VII large subunit [Pilibacter termitis]|uniref:Exodeoxyribonuclease 7 large subunit n=1 Tax=Pilibacter termitis TaxID=263852 RepID=A0A1T4NS44_9ENTE|nr:exodeoxyribonuclease VII large subunit [Pilibacter termitis]SJZ81937.1 Exodeoxyribonuclease VII large subunit [Pilibacter termitis]